jgi:hypothetical protein
LQWLKFDIGDFSSKLHKETIMKILGVTIASQVLDHGQLAVPWIFSPPIRFNASSASSTRM